MPQNIDMVSFDAWWLGWKFVDNFNGSGCNSGQIGEKDKAYICTGGWYMQNGKFCESIISFQAT